MMCSRILHGTDVREMGRSFSDRCLSPFLNTADTFAVRQSEGRTAVSNDRWKMSLSAGARVSAQFFKMTFGIWSGPHALSNLHTPAVLMLISLIIGCCGGSMCGEQIHHLW